MRNLLSHETKKALKTEYRLRLSVVGVILLGIALVIGVVSLFPPYVLSLTSKQSLEEQAVAADMNSETDEGENTAEIIRVTELKRKFVHSLQGTGMVSELVLSIVDDLPEGVTLNSFSYVVAGAAKGAPATKDKSSTGAQVVISGIARTRDNLLSFQNKLKQRSDFTTVELPVSNLAADKDIAFSITIYGDF